MEAIQLPNGFFNNDYSVYVNLEVPKSNPERKGMVKECGKVMVNTMYKTLYRVDFPNKTFAWHIN